MVRAAALVVGVLVLTGFCIDNAVLTPTDMIGYLTQARCPDGRPPSECDNAVPQTEDDRMHWRKHDYGTPEEGYQIQDAVVSTDRTHFINAWAFSRYDGRSWAFDQPKRFAAPLGDGGEIYRIKNGWAKVLMTQDGGTVAATGTSRMQYFCGGSGWVLFDDRPPAGSWRSTVARLNISTDQVSCPSPLNPAFTRWRRETLTIPFNILGTKKNLTLSCIISEHYNGSTIANAVDMEQAIWCKDWGRIWSAAYNPRGEGWLVFGYRLPGIPWGGGVVPERPDFKLADARLSTNIRATACLDRQADFGWPPVDYRP